jgi:hypothetical protein
MQRLILVSLLLLVQLKSLAQQTQPWKKVDYEALVTRASLNYNKPVDRSEEGMPVGNGRMGTLVWTTPSAIRFQLNRVDVFANNSASNNFYERHTDYCNGVGFVDVDFLTDVFTGKNFRQQLSCYDGSVKIEGSSAKAHLFTWTEQDVMAIQIENREVPNAMAHINLRMLRSPITSRGNHQAMSAIDVIGNKIVLVQTFKEDQFYCTSAVAIEVVGGDAKASLANETTARLSLNSAPSKFVVMVSSAASFNPHENIADVAIKKLDLAKQTGFDGMYQSSRLWWKQFWEKSFVQMSSPDGKAGLVEQFYNYYVYVMASSSRGAYPPKFNGMLWTTGGDARKWGNLYWGANQSCLYNALFPTNRMELIDPMFNMYSSMRESCEIAARQQWGSKGIFIPETVAFDGMAQLPEDIASEMRDLYLVRKPWNERTQKFTDYASTKMPFLSRWNWKKDDGWKDGRWHTTDKGTGPFGHVTHIFSRGAKIAYQYWLKYEYTLDKVWLRDSAYPMVKGVAEFYRNFPNFKKDQDGKYHIYHVNDNESVLGAHNTVEEIAAMIGILPVAIKASEILNVDTELRKSWKDVLDNLSPLPLSSDYQPPLPVKPATWARALPPVIKGDGNRLPDPNTLPVWFFDLCTLESDSGMLKTANVTFEAYFPKGIDENTEINVLSKLPIAGTLLGRADASRYLIPNQIATTEVETLPNRMDLREGFQTASIQRLGRAAEALHYALCQSVPPRPGSESVIRVFPAWPMEWDGQFKLLCRGGFLVSSSFRKGKIEFVGIESQAASVCRIRNPWPGKEIVLYRNNRKWKLSKDDLLIFATRKDDRFVLELVK